MDQAADFAVRQIRNIDYIFVAFITAGISKYYVSVIVNKAKSIRRNATSWWRRTWTGIQLASTVNHSLTLVLLSSFVTRLSRMQLSNL